MKNEQYLFHGIFFFIGTEIIPRDMQLDLTIIRKWAFNSGYVYDPEFQIMGEERVKDISQVFTPDDKLLIAISFSDQHEKVDYFEYPYVPVQSLIKKELKTYILYWRIPPYQENMINDVKFGFNIANSNEEYCSMVTAKKVVPKFVELVESLREKRTIHVFSDRSKEITVDDPVQATFYKDGRTFNVKFI